MKFLRAFFHLPATIFSGLTNFLFGSYQKDKRGNIITDRQDNPLTNPGLIGYIFMGIAFGFRAVANFISNHKTAIATAFWASLVVAGAAALTVALWPAALAAVTTFSIAGLSIAALVGTGFVAQVGAVAGLAAAATSVAVYAGATVANIVNGVRSWWSSRSNASSSRAPQDDFMSQPLVSGTSAASLSALSQTSSFTASASAAPRKSDVAPASTTSRPLSLRADATAFVPRQPMTAATQTTPDSSPDLTRGPQ